MADYTDIDSVRAILPDGVKIDSSLSRPNLAAVTSWISQTSSAATVAMATGGIGIPVADADLLATLKLLCSREVAYQVMLSRGVVDDSKAPPMWKSWHDDFTKALELMRAGEFVGPGSEVADTELPWSFGRDADETDPSDSRNPTITKDYQP